MTESPALRPQRRRVHSRLQNLVPELLTSILSFADGRSVANCVAALVGGYDGDTLNLLALAASRRALTDGDKEKMSIIYNHCYDVPWYRHCKAEGRRRFLIGERRLALEADELEARAASWYAEQEAGTDWAGGREQEWRTEADEETEDGRAAAAAAEAARVQAVCKAWGVVYREERHKGGGLIKPGHVPSPHDYVSEAIVDSTPVASFGYRGAYRVRFSMHGQKLPAVQSISMVLVDFDASMTPEADELTLWSEENWERDQMAYIETAPVCDRVYSVDMTRAKFDPEECDGSTYCSVLDGMRLRAPHTVAGVEYSRDEARAVADEMRCGAAWLRAFVAGVCLHGAEQRWDEMIHLQTVVLSVPDAELGDDARAFVVVSLSERNTCAPDCYCEGVFGVKVDLVLQNENDEAVETVVLLESTMCENQESRDGPWRAFAGSSDFANDSGEMSPAPAKTPHRGDLERAANAFGVPWCCVGVVVRALLILADPDQANGMWMVLEEANTWEHIPELDAVAELPGDRWSAAARRSRARGEYAPRFETMREGTFRYPQWMTSSVPKRNLFRFTAAREDILKILSDGKQSKFASAAEATAALIGQGFGNGCF